MSQTLRHGSEVATSARSNQQRASLKTVLGLLGASAVGGAVGCGSDSLVNNYYQGPDGHYVSLREPVPSNCTFIVVGGDLSEGETMRATASNGNTYLITLNGIESPRSREGLPPNVLLPAALYSVADTNANVLHHPSVREGGVKATVGNLLIQTLEVQQSIDFSVHLAYTNVYRCE